ncbi:NTP transferase domain-containing protein [Microbacterium sp. WCS2018Hpa-23]|uniref:molybdenum cofactor guanylyltransferase n=1 Tax=Microbacterium sp. WCS2018Hpa-23 TaxID=3073634 RepID=UPI0028833CBA|nr:NTP transferase domain-containing protein [Microbacterium sp. WCS2018Hpa-23]
MSPTSDAAPARPATPRIAAIILAGGRASRLGGAAKPLLDIDGRTLLDRAVAAVADCEPIVVVGPPSPLQADVVWARETPSFGGPVAGIAAGLALIDSAEVYVLAADLPNAEAAVAVLRQHPPLSTDDKDDTGDGAGNGNDTDTDTENANHDGLCLTDAAGGMQWLLGRYRTASLRRAVAALPDSGRGASMRALLADLALTTRAAGDLAMDVDTWDELERARAMMSTHRRDDAIASASDEETT